MCERESIIYIHIIHTRTGTRTGEHARATVYTSSLCRRLRWEAASARREPQPRGTCRLPASHAPAVRVSVCVCGGWVCCVCLFEHVCNATCRLQALQVCVYVYACSCMYVIPCAQNVYVPADERITFQRHTRLDTGDA